MIYFVFLNLKTLKQLFQRIYFSKLIKFIQKIFKQVLFEMEFYLKIKILFLNKKIL